MAPPEIRILFVFGIVMCLISSVRVYQFDVSNNYPVSTCFLNEGQFKLYSNWGCIHAEISNVPIDKNNTVVVYDNNIDLPRITIIYPPPVFILTFARSDRIEQNLISLISIKNGVTCLTDGVSIWIGPVDGSDWLLCLCLGGCFLSIVVSWFILNYLRFDVIWIDIKYVCKIITNRVKFLTKSKYKPPKKRKKRKKQ